MRRKPAEGPPPFIMSVQQGRLVPENAWDAERLASYSNGSRLSVTITSERNEKLRRKWWAILGQVVKSTGLFPSATKASEIVKEDLAITDSYKRDGRWQRETRSLTDMDEDELLDSVQRMMDYVHELTGVDYDQWHKETPDPGQGMEPSDGARSPSDEAGEQGTPQVTTSPATSSPAVDSPPQTAGEEGGTGAREGVPVSPTIKADMSECAAKYMALTQDVHLDAKGRQGMLPIYGTLWKPKLPDHLSFVELCHTEANKVITGKRSLADAKRIIGAAIP